MPPQDWERLVGPLGFRVATGIVNSGGSAHSLGCPALPARQQHSGGPGAYTSLSKTVTQVSRCAILALFQVILGHFVGWVPLLEPHAADDAHLATPTTAGRSSVPGAYSVASGMTAEGVLQPGSPHSSQQSTLPSHEPECTTALVVMAFRGLAEALPALPVGILQPGMSAAAIRLAHPVVLLLVETLEEQRQQQLQRPAAQQQRKFACCFCFNEGSPETSGHEWSALDASAAAVARRSLAEDFLRATATASAGTSGVATGPVAMQPNKQYVSGSTARGGMVGQGRQFGSLGRFEAFAAQVVGRGPASARLVGSCLAMLAAVIAGRQRQPQIAEALVLPIGSSAAVLGPSCLAALLCRAIQAFTSLWCHHSRDCVSCQTPHPAASALGGAAATNFGSTWADASAICAGPVTVSATRMIDTNGVETGDLHCSSCERHGLTLADGLFSALQAIAKRYPQVLLLLLNDSLAIDAEADGRHTDCSEAPDSPLACPERGGPFLEMLRSVLGTCGLNLRSKALVLATEVLGASRVAGTGALQEEAHVGHGASESHICAKSSGPSFESLSNDVIIRESLASLVALLHSVLIVPLLSGRTRSTTGPEPVRALEQQQPSGGPVLEATPPDLLSSACTFLCRLNHEEWQKYGLTDRAVLEALSGIAVRHHQRSIRLTATTALGTFAIRVMETELSKDSAANAAITSAALTTAVISDSRRESSKVRAAVLCLLLQLSDPLPDIRAAALCGLCEIAGNLSQQRRCQQESLPYCLRESAGELWREVLKAVNDVLHSGDKSAVVAIGLRAVGVVAPLVLLPQSECGRPTSGAARPATALSATTKAEPADAPTTGHVGEENYHGRNSRDEVIRSLTLLGGVLKPTGDGEGGRTADELPGNVIDPKTENGHGGIVAEGDGDLSSSEASAGLKQLKLHWNACHSIRLIFSSPAASLLLAPESCRWGHSPDWERIQPFLSLC